MNRFLAEASAVINPETILYVGIPAQLLFNGIVGYIAWQFRESSRQMSALKQKLHDITAKLVDERFRAMTHEVRNEMQGLVNAVEEFKGRLRAGDEEFRELGESDHSIELKMIREMAELKTYIIEHAASKDDMREHQRQMESKVSELRGEIRNAGGGRRA